MTLLQMSVHKYERPQITGPKRRDWDDVLQAYACVSKLMSSKSWLLSASAMALKPVLAHSKQSEM